MYDLNEGIIPNTNLMYALLRTAIFPTKNLARLAAAECRKYNPIGFVVVKVNPEVLKETE